MKIKSNTDLTWIDFYGVKLCKTKINIKWKIMRFDDIIWVSNNGR